MGNHRRIPEHVRLGIKPEDAGVSLLHDPESGMPRAPRKPQRIPPPPEPISDMPIRVPAGGPGEPTSFATPPFKRGRNAESAQADVRVHVGNHEESLWLDGLAPEQQQPQPNKHRVVPQGAPLPPPPLDDESVVLSRVAGTAHADATMDFEQPAADPRMRQQMEMPRQQPVQQEPSVAGLLPVGGIPGGAYGIFHDGELVFVSRNPQEVKQVVENWVLEHQVPIRSLMIFKNVPIGFGVILEKS